MHHTVLLMLQFHQPSCQHMHAHIYTKTTSLIHKSRSTTADSLRLSAGPTAAFSHFPTILLCRPADAATDCNGAKSPAHHAYATHTAVVCSWRPPNVAGGAVLGVAQLAAWLLRCPFHPGASCVSAVQMCIWHWQTSIQLLYKGICMSNGTLSLIDKPCIRCAIDCCS